MVGHGARFEQKMEQAIAALLSHRNVEDAARAVGISVNTLRRWMQVPEFQAACREARHRILSQAIGQLQNAAGAAAKTVLKIMVDPTVPAGIRLRAAEVVLAQAVKAGEMDETEDRLAQLELTARNELPCFPGHKNTSCPETGTQVAHKCCGDQDLLGV